MNRVFMVAARRTGISPKGGALANVSFHELAAMAARAVMSDAHVAKEQIDGLFLGNALAAGGNPARLAALALGLPCQVPAWSIDTQCCSGLDAIALAVDRIRAGSAHVLLAGGAESSSQAPQRAKRTSWGWMPYDEADFTPWPAQPSMLEAAHALGGQLGDTSSEYAWAVRSHQRFADASHYDRIPGCRDTFPRTLTLRACHRAATRSRHNPATMAPIADGAAMVMLLSEPALDAHLRSNLPVGATRPEQAGVSQQPVVSEVLSHVQVGSDPTIPGLATSALRSWIDNLREKRRTQPDHVELMESFASQTLANMSDLGLQERSVNLNGGLLATGHPIGASGAMLVARLHHRLLPQNWGVALIPSAGGLASGLELIRLKV